MDLAGRFRRRSFAVLPAVLAGALLGAFLVTGLLFAAPGIEGAMEWIRGGGYAGKVREPRFDFTHNEGAPRHVDTQRELFKIPEEYGDPFAVTTVNNHQVVWYRSESLGVRNVIIETDRLLVHILPRADLKETTLPPDGTR